MHICPLDGAVTKSELRWVATLWPEGTEAIAAHGADRIETNLDWVEADWNEAGYLEMLGNPFTTFGPMATLLLALGLAAKEPGEVGLAVDAAIAALGDSRLTGAALGEPMAHLLPSGEIKPKRWAKTLGVVAPASPIHAAQVAGAIQRALRGNPAQAPRDLGALVDLLRELLAATDARITDREAWRYLTRSRYSEKVRDLGPE